MRIFLLFLVSMLVAMVGWIGCSNPPKPVYDQPVIPTGYWETAWVEPRIIMADSIFTLIRADRIDSVYVEVDARYLPSGSPSIEFAVPVESCFVAVNLQLAERRGISYPLLARYMRRGNYKLTVNEPLKLEEFPPDRSYQLSAVACGQTLVVPVAR